MRKVSNFLSSYIWIVFQQLWSLFFPHWMDLAPLSKFNWPEMCSLNSVPSIHMSILMSITYSFGYCRFIVNFEVKKCEVSTFICPAQCEVWVKVKEIKTWYLSSWENNSYINKQKLFTNHTFLCIYLHFIFLHIYF